MITPIGLGVMKLAGEGGLLGRMYPVIPQEEINAIIKVALDGGINWMIQLKCKGLAYLNCPWQPDSR